MRVVLTRQQMFTFGYRPAQHPAASRSARTRDGALQAIVHDALTTPRA